MEISHSHPHEHGQILPRLLELDAVVHADFLADTTAWARSLTADETVSRVLDVGAGVGTGTLALAQRFAPAEIVALDIDEHMLDRVRERVLLAGAASQVSTVLHDVSHELSRFGTFDLIWSASAMHEVPDAARAFRNLFEVLRPGGILMVTELDASPWVLPADLSPLEQRVRAAGASRAAVDHPDWGAALTESGFEVLEARAVRLEQTVSGDGAAGDYAVLDLRRVVEAAGQSLDAGARDILTALLGGGEESLRHRDDLWIRGTRTVWAARRP